jgi:hypothetical protein
MLNKKLLSIMFSLALGLNAMAAGEDHSYHNMDHSKMDHSKMDHSKMKHKKMMKDDGKKKSLSATEKKKLEAVYAANEELHKAFFKYDAKTVETKAQALAEAVAKIEDKELSKLLSFSQKKLKDITASKSREDNNKSYHTVSMALIHVLKKFDVGSTYAAYSCPMVKKKWVQNTKKMAKVHNPYAPEMPHCGAKE